MRTLAIIVLLAAAGMAQEREYFVTGSVRSPGRFELTGDLTVEQAIAKAGGATEAPAGAILTVSILRKQGLVRTVVHARLTEAVQADDRLDVRYTKTFTVTGYVRSPGVFEYSDGLTVEKAIALAGGVTDQGSTSSVSLIRTVDGVRTRTTVKMTDVLQAADILEISRRRR